MSCNWIGDPLDRELHLAGWCKCALYASSPPQRRLDEGEARRLLGLMGFELCRHTDGRYFALDESRGIQVPDGSGFPSTLHTADELGRLVLRANCAHRLDGPLTISEASDQLEALGFELKTEHHRTYGRQWWAVSQERETSTGHWLTLKGTVDAARAIVAADRYRLVKQRRLPTLAEQLPRDDLDPTPQRSRHYRGAKVAREPIWGLTTQKRAR